MSNLKQIEVAIQKLAGTYLKDLIQIFPCDVDSINKENRTCDCTPIGGDATTSLPGVQLSTENNNGLVVYPKVGSTVIVALSTRNVAFVLMYSDIDEVVFMDGSYGGMVKVIELTNKLNNLENKINELIAVFNSWTPVPNDGGGALKTALASWVSSAIATTTRTEIENELIKHGEI